uniref:Uncharacterized protein n=1 Tax=Lymantria dispar multicapsid nuclear polyhedrosis virus TaxID=10449 RepID=A0A1B1MR18_NPVLD|nr:hypothetical protein [Lymantria dispar multiple nucleopolyhedrovirus]
MKTTTTTTRKRAASRRNLLSDDNLVVRRLLNYLTNTTFVPKGSSTTATVDYYDDDDKRANRAFYTLCGNSLRYLLPKLGKLLSLDAFKYVFDTIVEVERCLFNKSHLLTFTIGYLANHSDGQSLPCMLNLQLLSYLLTRYDSYINN